MFGFLKDDERRNQPKFAPLDWEDDDTSSARGHYEVDIRYEVSPSSVIVLLEYFWVIKERERDQERLDFLVPFSRSYVSFFPFFTFGLASDERSRTLRSSPYGSLSWSFLLMLLHVVIRTPGITDS